MKDPQEIQQVTDSLARQVEADKADQRYTETVVMVTVAISATIWAFFLLWDDFRDRLVKDGLWWLPLAATFMIAVAAVIVSKKGRPPSSG